MVTDTTIGAVTAVDAIEQRRAKLLSELDRFIEVVVPALQPERIIVFGSYATGQVHEWSDLDLVVIAETDLSFQQRLKLVYGQVRPRVGMDIIVYTPREWQRLSEKRMFVREEIAEKGKVVYERRRAAVG